ncbi:MAG: XRE family transcriptional regulator [Armatimonadetes bacterium Cent15-Ar3]|nr:MAG: XRE family transcriptional regulator [Armatimonadetes bacterium Cent15-Ar3]
MVVNASRLAVARECQGFTKSYVAQQLGVSTQAIKDYEDGNTVPSLHRLEELASPGLYDVPIGFFSREEIEDVPIESITFRSRRSLRASVRSRAVAKSRIASQDIARFLEAEFAMPEVDIPTDLASLSPEEAARVLRMKWGLGYGPIDNMVHLLEAKGVFVFWVHEDSKAVDGFAYWVDSRPVIFLNSFKESGERGRFDAAHELGHLILHADVPKERLDTKEIEDQANDFASAFLMPAEQFRQEAPRIHSIHAFLRLKPRWKVAVQAMVRRSRDLGLLTQWHYETAYKQMSMMGWRSGPEEGALSREGSHLHFVIFDALGQQGTHPEDVANQLDLRLSLLLELMPSANYFTKDRLSIKGNLRILSD